MKIIYFNGRLKINYKTRKCTFEQNLMENQKTYSRPKGSRMMPLPGLHIYFRRRVTLTFDLLTLKLTVLCPCPVDHCADFQQNRF